ncbi:MAG: peptidylprolyl isomerase [Planctomycetes bacterium]|nr:peptidylprolyl isomerase [Planctomycetota bacterium]
MKSALLSSAVLLGLFGALVTSPLAIAEDKPAAEKSDDKPEVDKSNKKLPQVLLKTSKGDILLELYEDEAPNTVANFVSLVEDKFYDGLKFHRVIAGFMAQGGDPTGTGGGGPGYKIKCECTRKDHHKHDRGVISMAHAGPNTGGSQFFITFEKTPHLDGRHTVFGHVIKGMEAVDKLKNGDVIEKAVVKVKRDHKYKPEVIK